MRKENPKYKQVVINTQLKWIEKQAANNVVRGFPLLRASSIEASQILGFAGHSCEEREPLNNITVDLKSEKLSLHLIQLMI